MGRLKGGFILSINDVPAIRKLFAAFEMQTVELDNTVAAGRSTPARELMIRRL